MQEIVPMIYDAAAVILILAMIVSSAGRGFACAAISLVGYVAALFGAAACANPLASGIYQMLIRPRVEKEISEKLVTAQAAPEALLEVVEEIPSFLFDAVEMDREDLLRSLMEMIENGGTGVARSITDAVVAPLCILLIRSVLFLLIFGAAIFLVRRLAIVFEGMNELPVIGPANRIFGGVVGFVEALLTLYVIILLIDVVLAFAGGSLRITVDGRPFVLAGDAVFQKTVIFRQLLRFNPIDWVLHFDFSSLGHRISSAGKTFV